MSEAQYLELDSYTNLYLDSIAHREEKGQLYMKLGTSELESVKFMRERILQFTAKRLGVDTDTNDIALDTKARKLVVVPKLSAPETKARPAPDDENEAAPLEEV